MDAILQFLIDWGYWGLFLGSFIAGSVLPFSSEAVLAACVGPLGLDPVISIAAATAGNVAGGMTCYWMGHLGNMEWIEKYFHVKKEKMDRAERFVHGRGAWMAFFAFIPILGSAISIVLGMMRANIWIVVLAMTTGKILRYALLVWGVLEATALIH
ncbi:VTT domain-containing protein [Phocaeicola sp.]|uniref:YqaA family protein n=1 Tax=Phocaeicola sp. TaxID=2773926 RepID=UPI0023D15007|nr:VTT domain-containing protein [Phocaeicola sp.]MDE5678441.1 VTT domain-containing protein [Phocaeicola sp.]